MSLSSVIMQSFLIAVTGAGVALACMTLGACILSGRISRCEEAEDHERGEPR